MFAVFEPFLLPEARGKTLENACAVVVTSVLCCKHSYCYVFGIWCKKSEENIKIKINQYIICMQTSELWLMTNNGHNHKKNRTRNGENNRCSNTVGRLLVTSLLLLFLYTKKNQRWISFRWKSKIPFQLQAHSVATEYSLIENIVCVQVLRISHLENGYAF